MEKQHTFIHASMGSLIGLIILNWAMIQALFAQVPPNPPGQFGPYISSTLALAVVSLYLVYHHYKTGYISSIIVGLMCLLSAGPQKFFIEPNAILLTPVIILGTTFSVILIVCSILNLKRKI
jgi:energy-converting hydrogenase Eha subunit A